MKTTFRMKSALTIPTTLAALVIVLAYSVVAQKTNCSTILLVRES